MVQSHMQKAREAAGGGGGGGGGSGGAIALSARAAVGAGSPRLVMTRHVTITSLNN